MGKDWVKGSLRQRTPGSWQITVGPGAGRLGQAQTPVLDRPWHQGRRPVPPPGTSLPSGQGLGGAAGPDSEWLDFAGVPFIALIRGIDQPFDPDTEEAGI